MDKKRLNNEIILCRPAIRKAKVAVIRKLIKEMKILRACKVEAVKEKKLRRSERLFKKVQVMKRIKVDEVTKFALRHSDVAAFLKSSKLNLRQNSLAHLARHKAVVKKINFIREQIENWEEELPILLDSLGRKKKSVNKQKTADGICKTTVSNSKEMSEGGNGGQLKNISLMDSRMKRNGKVEPSNQSSRTSSDNKRNSEENLILEPVTKIEDPFFLGKKIAAPKLVLESLSNRNESDKLEKSKSFLMGRENVNSTVFDKKLFKAKRNSYDFKTQKPVPTAEAEKLHPSWAAKKVKLIKPFQGKKITFSDD